MLAAAFAAALLVLPVTVCAEDETPAAKPVAA
jgi:hypothetical protein